jgi:signal peptidase I
VNVEHDEDRALAAHTARAEAEAKRILHAALEQAAVLQVEMSKEVEAETQRRLAAAEREIAARFAVAEREAAERVRQSVDTAAALLLNARKEADRIRAEVIAAPSALPDGSSAGPAAESSTVDAELSARAATARLSEAEALAAARIADAELWSRQHLAEADEIGTQRLLEAEVRAREIIEQALAEAAALTASGDEPATAAARSATDVRPPPPPPPPNDGSPAYAAGDPGELVAAGADGRSRFPRLAKTARVVLLVVAAVVGTDLLRSCVAEPYTVASTSMEPEFHDGDRLVVNKLAYRMGDVGRNDIVVIDTSRVPGATTQLGKTLVKRVVGLPGDIVEGVDGRVRVNGEQLDEPWLDEAATAPFGPVQVPEDSVFVLGDNRAASVDSRTFGAVPIGAVIGRVDAIVWPPGNAGRP